MKHRISALLFILLLLPTFVISVCAEQTVFVIDNADLLTRAEEEALTETISDLRWIYEMDIVILTESTLNGQRPQEHADDYYDENGYAEDGLLFLLSMEERDWYISTSGNAIYALTDYGIQSISEEVLGYLSGGAYYDAFDAFLYALPEYLDAFAAGSPIDGYADYRGDYYHGDQAEIVYYEEELSPSFFLSLIIGIVAALISVLIMRFTMRTGRPQRSAGVYLKNNAFRLKGHRDLFLYSNVSKVRKQQNTNHSGGGSSVHRSSGGGRHGGGGGKF